MSAVKKYWQYPNVNCSRIREPHMFKFHCFEVDGQWGPYLPCNPVNISDPYGAWNCTTDFMHHNPPDYPHVCVANNYSSAYEGYAIMGIPDFRLKGVSLSDCCSEAAKHSTPSKSIWGTNFI